MIKKWKCILTNWINCYYTESVEKDQSISVDTLINIITHLRESLNLDESKSSVLEAHTVAEFILEKYPEFKFKNGSTEPSTDNDLYFAASLLLFFVCVNSKDTDIKSAMCNMLSPDDQTIILKFSKHLMECSVITHKDVQSAIQEACSQDVAAAEPVQQTVAETPPPLRSLHGEVRRLQAALDAERFDRNYLQDELSRSNLKLEKLLKDKENYKLEILNLKAKISLTSVQNDDSNSQTNENNSAKLLRQIQCLEERLGQTLEQIDELQFERDTLKSKVEELKKERDKWLLLGQESVSRVDQLLDELETERRQVQSYKELVSELRTHNQRNGLDLSQLECDDPDTSVRSLPHNTSVCSEACANVVEVQLLEERAKIADLKQQLQTLQQEIFDLTHKADTDIQKYEELLGEKDEYILNLKHKINQEIDEKALISNNLNDEITKLNNEINELDQKFKEHKESCRQTIDKKTQEITTLQEEKMSLLQSLSDETTKLETHIKELQNTLDTEKSSNKSLSKEYENQIMHLNEKVLNRNNELVELQNNVFSKSEKIESMRIALEMREGHLQSLMEQVTCVEAEMSKLQNKLADEQNNKLQMKEDYENKLMKMNEKVLNRNNELVELQNNVFEKSEKIESMRVLLENKTTDLDNLTLTNKELANELEKLQQQYYTDVSSKDNIIAELQIKVQTLTGDISNKNIEINSHVNECEQLKAKIVELNQEFEEESKIKQKRIANLEHKIATLNKKLSSKKEEIENLKARLGTKIDEVGKLMEEKKDQSELLSDLENAVTSLKKELSDKSNELELLKQQYDSDKKANLTTVEGYEKTISQYETKIGNLNMIIKELNGNSEEMKNQLEQEKQEKLKQKNDSQSEIAHLYNELSSRGQECEHLGKEVESKAEVIDKLNKEVKDLHESVRELTDRLHKLETKNIQLNQKCKKNKILAASEKKSQDEKIIDLNETISNLEGEIKQLQNSVSEKTKSVDMIKKEWNDNNILLEDAMKKIVDLEISKKELQQVIQEKQFSEQGMKESYEKTLSELNEKIAEFEAEQQVLKNVVTVTESIMTDQKEAIEAANKDVAELQQRYQATTSSFEEEKTILQQIIQEKELLCKEKTKQLESAQRAETKLLEETSCLKEQKTSDLSKIEQLQLQITSAGNEFKSLKDSLATANKELADIRALNTFITESCETEKKTALERELTLNKEITILQSKLQTKSTETQNLVAQIENTEFIFRNKIESLQDYYNKETQSLISKLVDLENIKDKLESTLGYHNIELKNLRIELEEREIEIKKINNENYSLNCELKEKQDDLLKLAYERESLLEMKAIIENDKSQLSEENKILKDQLENEKQDKGQYIENVSKELAIVQNDNEKLNQSIETLNQNIKDAREEIDLKNYQIETMKVQHKNLDEMYNKLSESNEILQVESEKKIETLTLVYKQLQESHRNKMDEMEKAINDLKTELKTREQEVDTFNNTIEHLKLTHEKALQEKELRSSSLESELEVLCIRNKALITEINDLKSNVTSLEVKIKEIGSSNEELQKEKDKYVVMMEKLGADVDKKILAKEKELNELEFDNISLKKLVEENKLTLDTLTVNICEFEAQNAKTLDENKELVGKCTQLEASNDKLLSELDQCKKEIETLQTALNNYNEEKATFKTELQTVTESLKTKECLIKQCNQEKCSLDDQLAKEIEAKNKLQEENLELNAIQEIFEAVKIELQHKIEDKEQLNTILKEHFDKATNENNQLQALSEELRQQIETLKDDVNSKGDHIQVLTKQNKDNEKAINDLEKDVKDLQSSNNELKIIKDQLEVEIAEKIGELNKELHDKNNITTNIQATLNEHNNKVMSLENKLIEVNEEKLIVETERDNIKDMLHAANIKIEELNEKIKCTELDRNKYAAIIDENKTVITNLEQLIKHELEQNQHLREESGKEKLDLTMKCTELQGHRTRMERDLEDKQNELKQLHEINAKNNEEIAILRITVNKLNTEVDTLTQELKTKENLILKLTQDKDSVISAMSKELLEEKETRDKYQKELELKATVVYELRHKLEGFRNDEVLRDLRKENEEVIRAIGHRENVAADNLKKSPSRKSTQSEKIARMFFQVDNTPSTDNSHTSNDSYKNITDLEKILHDKNQTIATLQSDITYLKTLIADSENKLLDTARELDIAKENCEQLSNQLKKTVTQKNDEITELKKHVNKMSATENRATEIIKLSAKYQAIILKRIAEIKSNTILKELTNFGNSNGDNEKRRGLQATNVTMDDLENFLDTTDRHLKRCSEKIAGLQKERDRLYEVARINESEIINMKKFLTELSVGYKTFNSVKEVYMQKLSRVVTLQRTVRRDILALEGRVSDASMCKLERGYAAVIQDLAEAALTAQRWVERCLSRTISPEKIKQAFTSELDRASLSQASYQNAALESHIDSLEKSFQQLAEEVAAAATGDGAREPQAVTVMEVRAEYEDKLNRMKDKMRQLYQEQISVYKEKQKEEIASLHRDLQRAKEKLSESSRAYEEHIRALTAELWSVGEKFLVQKDEAEWLRKKQRTGSLMSLQHVHSSGLIPPLEEPPLQSDTASLRSLPVHCSNSNVRDRELLSTPRSRVDPRLQGHQPHQSQSQGQAQGQVESRDSLCITDFNSGRLSELRWRNSLCPPHLRSLYPAETQFTSALDEDLIKCTGRESMVSRDSISTRGQRKEVGITAYKKPGPPTPSKQAGRLSATDSELRESLRVEADPAIPRKTASPSRLRALFRSSRHDASDMTPRKRLSNIFRKK